LRRSWHGSLQKTGDIWKLDSYRRFDATHDPGDEPYCITACKIFNKPIGTYTKDSPERSVGKTADLAFGYSGGLGAWRKFEPGCFTDDEWFSLRSRFRNTLAFRNSAERKPRGNRISSIATPAGRRVSRP
jgi:hypothetical protein